MRHKHEDEEAYQLRLERRQWLDPNRKEEVMGKLKQMLLNWGYMSAEDIMNRLFTTSEVHNKFSCKWLLGFGEASYENLESLFGIPAIHSAVTAYPGGLTITCAWGFEWEDGNFIIIHDRNSAVQDIEDTKHWHVSGTHEGWARIKEGFICDPQSIKLTRAGEAFSS
jgi:hypothetical protein